MLTFRITNYCLIFLIAITLFGCNHSNPSLELSEPKEGSEQADLRSTYEDYHRLRVNEDYSILVTAYYVDDLLDDVDYTIVNETGSDKYYLLDLRTNKTSMSGCTLSVLNENINSLTYVGDLISALQVGGTMEEPGCECNDTNPVNDCILRTYYNEIFCDGTDCVACSLVLSASSSYPSVLSTEHNSYIIVP